MRSDRRGYGAGVSRRAGASAARRAARHEPAPRDAGDRRGFGRLLGAAGLALTVIASGVLLPGSTPDSVPDSMLAAMSSSSTDGAPATPAPTPAAFPVSAPRTALPNFDPADPAGDPADPADPTRPEAPNDPMTYVDSWAHASEPGTTSWAVGTSEPGAPTLPVIGPSPALEVQIPAIDVDATVVPVDSKPTGKTNAWGGPIYRTIDFPVDGRVRQWVRRGDPNTLSAAESTGNVKAFDRVLLYGHASDIGNHLVFQDLSAVAPGDDVIVRTAKGRFTYQVTELYTRTKTDLNSLAALYDYPTGGAKDIALVACLPDTTSNVVVLGTLVDATAAP